MAASGQTINDRLNAVRYALSGQGLARTVCKATTLEVLGPKKKHIDYLLACTNEPNVSTPQLANLLIERTQHTNWAVVFKSLISIHHLMSYGNERFTQYLATSNHNFELADFMDRTTPQGYNMSAFVRRYAKYINDKTISYRKLAIDLCKIRSGNDNALRTMNMDNLSKTLPIVQTQFDSLLEFCAEPKDLNNGVIMAAFRLLYKDLVRLYVAYQEAIINLLERYFKLGRKKAREALDMYKKYLARMDKVAEFLRVVDAVGLDKSEQIDLTRSPASILPALEQHLAQLEANKRGATPTSPSGDEKQVAPVGEDIAPKDTKVDPVDKENEAPTKAPAAEASTKPPVSSPAIAAPKAQPPPKPARPVSPMASPKKSPQASKPPPPSSISGATSKAAATSAEKKPAPSRPPPPSSATAPAAAPPPPPADTPKAPASTLPAHQPPPPHPPPPAAHHAHTSTHPEQQQTTPSSSDPATSINETASHSPNTNGQSSAPTEPESDAPRDPPQSASFCSAARAEQAQDQVDENPPTDGVNHSEQGNENGNGCTGSGETSQEPADVNHVNNGTESDIGAQAVAEDEVLPPPPPPMDDDIEEQPAPPPPVEDDPDEGNSQSEVDGEDGNKNE